MDRTPAASADHEPRPGVDGETGRMMTATGEANVGRILDAALGHFARFGFQGARVDAIARDAGLSKPNLLYYFRSKHALYLAVLRRTLDMWLQPLREINEATEPRAALEQYITRKLEYSRDHPEASRVFALEIMQGAPVLADVLENDLRQLVDAKTTLIGGWITAGRLRGAAPYHLIFTIWAVTQHYADFSAQVGRICGRDLSDPGFFAETRDAVLALLLDGAVIG